ncbi:hypothetical protein BDW75DRAFT_242327 [Aspergillus navahoensis]
MQVLPTLISVVAVMAIATAVPAKCDGKPFLPGSGGNYHERLATSRDAQVPGTRPFPPGSGGDYWDGRGHHFGARDIDGHKLYLNSHGPTIPIRTQNAPDNMTPRDLEGKDASLPSPNLPLDTSAFDGPCKVNSDCNVGSFCIANWCTLAHELDDGTLVLPSRDIVGEDDEYWYYKSRTAIDVLNKLTGKVDTKNIGNACPKKCDGKGGTKKCCPRHFCQPPRCLGDPDDFKDHD